MLPYSPAVQSFLRVIISTFCITLLSLSDVENFRQLMFETEMNQRYRS